MGLRPTSNPTSNKDMRGTLLALLVVAIFILGTLGAAYLLANDGIIQLLPRRDVQTAIVAGYVNVGSMDWYDYLITVPLDAQNPYIKGTFYTNNTFSAGNDKTIQIVVTASYPIYNYQTGLFNSTIYYTERVANGSIDINLQPGQYFLIFNNMYSPTIGKTVGASVGLFYEQTTL